MTTTYHPTTQRVAEHADKFLLQTLRRWHIQEGISWDIFLDPAVLSMNYWYNIALKCCPSEVFMGIRLRPPIEAKVRKILLGGKRSKGPWEGEEFQKRVLQRMYLLDAVRHDIEEKRRQGTAQDLEKS